MDPGQPGSAYFVTQTQRPLGKSSLYLLGLSREVRGAQGIGGGQLLCFKVGISESLTSSIGRRFTDMNKAFKKFAGGTYADVFQSPPGTMFGGPNPGTYLRKSVEFPGSYQVQSSRPKDLGGVKYFERLAKQDEDLYLKVNPKETFWKMCIPERGIIPIQEPQFELRWFWFLDRGVTALAELYVKQYLREHTAERYGLPGGRGGLAGNSEIILGLPFTVVYEVILKGIAWAQERRVSPPLFSFNRCRVSGLRFERFFPKWRDGAVEYDLPYVAMSPESEEDSFAKYEIDRMYLIGSPQDFVDIPSLGDVFTKLRF